MRTDPKPNDDVFLLAQRNSAVAAANASREHRLFLVNLLEVEARMVRVVDEELIRGAGLLTNIGRKRRE